jgi:Holliday junction DNA helicase RuvB
VIGEGPHARTVKLPLPKFTLLGATTRTGLLTGPLRDRFGYVAWLNFYSPEELARVVTRSGQALHMQLTPEGALEIAKRSRGTPRIANRLLRRVRDFAAVQGHVAVDRPVAAAALELLEVDHAGFDPTDRSYLQKLCAQFGGGPVGIEALAAAMGEQRDTLEDVYEPFLLQQGYVARTPRGRMALAKAWLHIGLPEPQAPEDPQQRLI